MTYPWKDHAGRTSPLKLAVFVALFAPALWIATAFALDWLGPRPLTEAIHQLGLWAIRLIFLALAVTPLRHILNWSRLLVVRRMIGVAASAYAIAHLGLYAADEAFDLAKVATEIVLRIYLTIGFAAVLGLAALAATSTDGMIRRLGARRWRRLHLLVYAIALLAVVHYCMQSKLDLWEPTIMAGLYGWLIGYRVLARPVGARTRLSLLGVAALGVTVAVLTALGEAVYFRIAYGADPMLVIAANWSLDTGLRPAVVVLAVTLAVAAAGGLRRLVALRPERRARYA
ncbi:MAG: sulfite oxidase heme-binding subunit YedZ [Alphaproteobacteria bacterium]